MYLEANNTTMESSLKTWLIRIIFVVPALCLIISVVLWKHGQNETFDIQTVKRVLKEYHDEIQKLHDAYHVQKRDMQSQIESANMKFQQQQEQLHAEIDKRHAEKREVQNDKVIFKRQLEDDRIIQIRLSSSTGGGAVFVHWGRMTCSSGTDLVYSGIAGGGSYSHPGAAVNMLCMTKIPVWANYGNHSPYYALLYGTEYEMYPNDFPLGHDRAEKLLNHDVPCSVCRSGTRTSVIMIPGTTRCTPGWTVEYSGYLMAGRYTHPAATEYNCIDANPDAHESGAANKNGYLLYAVKAKCGSLPCPPYFDMREITCVVCTK